MSNIAKALKAWGLHARIACSPQAFTIQLFSAQFDYSGYLSELVYVYLYHVCSAAMS